MSVLRSPQAVGASSRVTVPGLLGGAGGRQAPEVASVHRWDVGFTVVITGIKRFGSYVKQPWR